MRFLCGAAFRHLAGLKTASEKKAATAAVPAETKFIKSGPANLMIGRELPLKPPFRL
jgi:hypothetical protein